MKKLILPLITVFICGLLQAQTWTGSASTDWNTAGNWSPVTVPTIGSSVTIPGTVVSTRWPVLASNVSIANISTSPGAQMNVNGFTFTTGNFDLYGITINNTNGATDIILTLNGGGTNYFRSCVINDNSTINFNGALPYYEGLTGGNTYNGNTIYNVASAAEFNISYDNRSTFNGNLTISRTLAGTSNIFRVGGTVNGNFSYTNNVGGVTAIGQNGGGYTPVSGTFSIASNLLVTPSFGVHRVKNLTSGGSINMQKAGYVLFNEDTLLLSSFRVDSMASGNVQDFYRNSITAPTINISTAAANTGSIYMRQNLFNGNFTYTHTSADIIYEGFTGGNTYNGNTVYNIAGTGQFNISFDNRSTFNGNLTISRTVAGTSNIFRVGGTVNGNFSYTNNVGGSTAIGQNSGGYTPVSGTFSIASNLLVTPSFGVHRVKNQTTGGSINIQKAGYVLFYEDTLLLSSFRVDSMASGNVQDFYRDMITAPSINISTAAANTGSIYIRQNLFNGNFTYTHTSADIVYEGFTGGNTYNGNTVYNMAGTGQVYISFDNRSTFNGNLTTTRTVAGLSNIFHVGGTVNGNFSYTNNVGGSTAIGQSSGFLSNISGTLNIASNPLGFPNFGLYKIKNQTPGGDLIIQKTGFTVFVDDSLVVNNFKVDSTVTVSTNDFLRNSFTAAAISISEAAASTGSPYIRQNTFTGNTTIIKSGNSILYEAFQGANNYVGNANFIRNAGAIIIAFDNPTHFHGSLNLTSGSGITFTQPIRFRGSANGTIEQLGTQPISIPTLIMEKTGAGSITLNDSVTITGTATFTSGHINSSTANHLIFPDNISYTGASAASHVIGPVTKIGDDIFTFPVGGPVSLNTVRMSAPVGATSRFSAEYKAQNPTIDGFNTSLKAGSFGAAAISNAGYWDVQRLSGATNVTLTLGFGTNPYEGYPVLASLKVAHWNGAQWDDHANGGTTGTAASGTVVNSVPITSFSPFAIAGVNPAYFFSFGQPGPGPDGSPIKLKGIGGYPAYTVKQLPGGAYTADSIFLVANGSTTSFRLKDLYGVEKDTTITAPASPVNYAAANGNGTVNFTGWRHFVYLRDGGGNMMGAIKDNNLTLGNTVMNTYFSTASVASSPNGNIYLNRSFKITSQFAPVGIKRVRFYILKTEFNNLVAADPTSFPGGINSLTITKYTGPMEDSLFSPQPGGNAVIIPNSAITIADLGTIYSLDIDVDGFSGFYIGGNNMNLNLCSGSTITLPSNISGASYQWQVDNGGGFTNISNGGIYSGATTSSLTITNPPNTIYGYQYRAMVNGGTPSQAFTIKLNNSWTGTANTAWENLANWSCGALPTDNSDVIINAGKPNYPQLNSNATIRTLRVNPGATVTVKTGFTLTVKQ